MKITKDGDHYMVAADDFINLAESYERCFFIDQAEYDRFVQAREPIRLGVHGKECPCCLGGDCECWCKTCRPDLTDKNV